MEQASYFREKAAQCRRLAAALAHQGDPVAKTTLRRAEEFEAKVAACAAQEEPGNTVEPGGERAAKTPAPAET